MAETLRSVDHAALTEHVLCALARYWPTGKDAVAELPVAKADFPRSVSIPRFEYIALPEWASHASIGGFLFAPAEACPYGEDWRSVDWWLAAFLMLECWHERTWENQHGAIHSYSFRLRGWDTRLWERAWVNRIALFLRAWSAQDQGRTEEDIFGSLPETEIVVTHDVDAVTKTVPIRLKQSLFNLINAGRCLIARDYGQSVTHIREALRFLISREDWWMLDEIVKLEYDADIRSHLNFHADTRSKNKNSKSWLFDPGYDITSKRLESFMHGTCCDGWTVGLHPGFDSWNESRSIKAQKETLESVSGRTVSSCRQHWLRFSWHETWKAQQTAGLLLDTTLGFNDRPGFRNGAALMYHPWSCETKTPLEIQAMPLVLMDSHLYDYAHFSEDERAAEISRWMNEIHDVRGTATVLWHPHTLSRDYGWRPGFVNLLSEIKRING